METVFLLVVLTLPDMEEGKPVIYKEPMASVAECNATVREMTYRAKNELRGGGRLQVGCVIEVPRSENP